MNNKNSKSNNYVIREAENIIEDYLKTREMQRTESYKILKEKYERLKIFTASIFFAICLGIILNLLHIY